MFFLFSFVSLLLGSFQDLRTGKVYDFTWILLAIPCLNTLLSNGFTVEAVTGVVVGSLLLALWAGLVVSGYLGGADWFAYLALLVGLPFQSWLLANLLLTLNFAAYLWYIKLTGKKENNEYFVVPLFLATLVLTKIFYLFLL